MAKRLLILNEPPSAGAREHAFAWLAAQSPAVEQVFCLTGNAGIIGEPKHVLVPVEEWPTDIPGFVDFAKRREIDLTVVGPEGPLARKAVDAFQSALLPIFGPRYNPFMETEGSKHRAKEMMLRLGVPTGKAQRFMRNQMDQAIAALTGEPPYVIKADGLAAGKGVTVALTRELAEKAIRDCFDRNVFKDAGDSLLIEEYLDGSPRRELSIIAVVAQDGSYVLMLPAQDYKPVFDGDKGDNTGGMGAFAPVPWVKSTDLDTIKTTILEPIIGDLNKRGISFTGFLYLGLKLTAQGWKVVELNARAGDPEILPLAMLLETDLIPILELVAKGGSLKGVELKWKPGGAVTVVACAPGYPGKYEKDMPMSLTMLTSNGHRKWESKYLHAGTRRDERGRLLTNGGRVVDATVSSPLGIKDARDGAYNLVTAAALLGSGTALFHIRQDIADPAHLGA